MAAYLSGPGDDNALQSKDDLVPQTLDPVISTSENQQTAASISSDCPEELVQKRKLVEESSDMRQAPPNDGRICFQCAQLDLQKAIELQAGSKNKIPYDGLLVASVGHRYRQPLETDCPLCFMLSASRVTTDLSATSSRTHSTENYDELRAYSFLDHSNLLARFSGDDTEYNFRRANDSMYLAVVPRDFTKAVNLTATLLAHGQRNGYAIFFQGGQQATIFAAQVVLSRFDPGPVRLWLKYCECHHKTLCWSTNSKPHGLKLIDCETFAIQDVVDDNSYVALSYVWGSANSYDCQVQTSNGRSLLPLSLPAVISDAISITKAIGFRYLWIDKFCIDQNDAENKHDQIQQMDAIYENSELTIIAAAGHDESYGLPGVGFRSRGSQPTVRIGKVEVIWTMRDPHNSIRGSKWFTRGWTFQEAFLSRRRLVFTEEQVYFECKAMNCFESIHSPLDVLHIEDKSKLRECMRAGIFGANEKQVYGIRSTDALPLRQSFFQYLMAVEEYSGRKLRYDQDSLNAFQGIIRQFSRRKIPFHEIWGVSYPATDPSWDRTTFLVSSLTWSHVQSCWNNSRSPRRRPEFPSWSWAGWAGKVEYRRFQGLSSFDFVFANKLRNVSLESQSGSLIMFDTTRHLPRENSGFDARVIQVEAIVLSPKLFSYDPTKEYWTGWTVSNYMAELALSQGPNSENLFFEELQEGYRWQCVFVGLTATTNFVMILKTHADSGTSFRAGLFIVHCDGFAFLDELYHQNAEYRTYRIE
jgi:hypothetical protein